MKTRYYIKGDKPWKIISDFEGKFKPIPEPVGPPKQILIENSKGHGCAGLFFHAPLPINNDVYARKDGHLLYYYDCGVDVGAAGKGSWMTCEA